MLLTAPGECLIMRRLVSFPHTVEFVHSVGDACGRKSPLCPSEEVCTDSIIYGESDTLGSLVPTSSPSPPFTLRRDSLISGGPRRTPCLIVFRFGLATDGRAS